MRALTLATAVLAAVGFAPLAHAAPIGASATIEVRVGATSIAGVSNA